MDKFKFGLFDVFAYTIPGVLVMFILYFCLKADLQQPVWTVLGEIAARISSLSLNAIALGILISYIAGFAVHYLGYRYFKWMLDLTSNILERKKKKQAPLTEKKVMRRRIASPEKERILARVRHYSPVNFAYVEQWYTFRGMAYNLSLFFGLLAVAIFIREMGMLRFALDWTTLALMMIILALLCFLRARDFHHWAEETLLQTEEMLKLDDQIK